jgi:hypothetical protein
MAAMLRRISLPILIAWLWMAWATRWVVYELDMLGANPKALALAIAMRECGGGDIFRGGDLMKLDCGDRTLREVVESIGEPGIWTGIWRLRESFAGFIFVPPMWFLSKAIIGLAVCYLCMIAWRLVRRRRDRLQSSPALKEWRAGRNQHWPLNNAAAGRKS